MTNIELIEDLIQKCELLPIRDDQELDVSLRRAKMVARRVFGETTGYVKEIDEINFHPTNFSVSYIGVNDGLGRDHLERIWRTGQKRLMNVLTTMADEVRMFGEAKLQRSVELNTKIETNRIFVVHGHDETIKQSVARVVEKLGLETIILHEQPNRGRTIIEKFTDYSNVGFAIILLSPDDVGYDAKKQPAIAQARARQNVILEMGFFLGKLGREHVFVLYPEDGSLELPSDYSGVLYTKYDTAGRWQLELVQELKAVGYDVDANKLVRGN